MAEPEAMVVFLDTADGGAIKAIPQNFNPAELLVFSSWRHALAFCDVAGVQVENRNIADLLAEQEEQPPTAPEHKGGVSA
jgi:hypothetical protein